MTKSNATRELAPVDGSTVPPVQESDTIVVSNGAAPARMKKVINTAPPAYAAATSSAVSTRQSQPARVDLSSAISPFVGAAAQVASLRELRDGWRGPRTLAPKGDAIRDAQIAIQHLLGRKLTNIRAASANPTDDGRIGLTVIAVDGRDIELWFGERRGQVEVVASDDETDESRWIDVGQISLVADWLANSHVNAHA